MEWGDRGSELKKVQSIVKRDIDASITQRKQEPYKKEYIQTELEMHWIQFRLENTWYFCMTKTKNKINEN